MQTSRRTTVPLPGQPPVRRHAAVAIIGGSGTKLQPASQAEAALKLGWLRRDAALDLGRPLLSALVELGSCLTWANFCERLLA